jgi:hypothetical protein
MNSTIHKNTAPAAPPRPPEAPAPPKTFEAKAPAQTVVPRDRFQRSPDSAGQAQAPAAERDSHIAALTGNFGAPKESKESKAPKPESPKKDRLTIVSDESKDRPAPPEASNPKLEPNVPPYVKDSTVETQTGPHGESIKETSYEDNGVQVRHIATQNPDGTTRVEEVRTTANSVERSVTDTRVEDKPLEVLVPEAADNVKNNAAATGERGPTEISHTVTSVTNTATNPPETRTLQDTTSYEQQIQAKEGELWKDGKAVLPEQRSGIPGVDGLQAANQTLTYTSGTQFNPETGADEKRSSFASQTKVTGTNAEGGPAEISQTRISNTLNGQPAPGSITSEYKGFLTRDNVDDTGGPNGLRSGGAIPSVPAEFAGRLPESNLDVRQTVVTDASGQPQSTTSEFGNYAHPDLDGNTVTMSSQPDQPTTLALRKVSEGGHRIQTQSVAQGTKLSTVSDTHTDGQHPPTTSTRSETRNDGKLVSRTSQGTRPVAATQVQEPPLDSVNFDAEQRAEFLRRVGANTMVSETYSNTEQFLDDGKTPDQDSVSHNVSYESEHGVRISATNQPVPLGQDIRTGELKEWGPHGPSNPSDMANWRPVAGDETATTLSDPNHPIPTSVATTDWKGKRELFTEAADGSVQQNGVLLEMPKEGDLGSESKHAVDGLLRPGANLARAALNAGTSKTLGVVSAGLAYANFGHALVAGELPTWKDTLSVTTGTGTLAKMSKPLEGFGKGLGYLGYGLTGVTGLSQLADGQFEEGAINSAVGLGGVLTTIGGAAGPWGWGILLAAGGYSLATAEDPTATLPLEI